MSHLSERFATRGTESEPRSRGGPAAAGAGTQAAGNGLGAALAALRTPGTPAAPRPPTAAAAPPAPLPRPPAPPRSALDLAPPQTINAQLHDDRGQLRRSAPAGTPDYPVAEWMTAQEELEVCWTNMPGAIFPNERCCRYDVNGRISRYFCVTKFENRDNAHNPVAEDEDARCLWLRQGTDWVPVDLNRVSVVAPRHNDYYNTIYMEFHDRCRGRSPTSTQTHLHTVSGGADSGAPDDARVIVKAGRTDNLQRRMAQYAKCGPGQIFWVSYYPTDCVKATERITHLKFALLGAKIAPFMCACKTRHHEYVCYEGAGELEGAERVIEETLRSLGQVVVRYSIE
ncbi:hypothetical protein MVEN_00002800 [Mycena venus]|uniref:Bacteriophage T5 Orf172 DNA-binding domain-containing protein n=1 Tax=Mycena venus TaxID=2733690 RepID=A0A8H6Z675_9AGAR|nr:hypothetical protein MVEN_00002800 [Mycena venus]